MFLRMNSGFREWVEVVWDRVAKEWLSEWVNVFGSSGGRVNQCEVVYVSRIDARIQSEWSYGWKDFFMKKKRCLDEWKGERVTDQSELRDNKTGSFTTGVVFVLYRRLLPTQKMQWDTEDCSTTGWILTWKDAAGTAHLWTQNCHNTVMIKTLSQHDYNTQANVFSSPSYTFCMSETNSTWCVFLFGRAHRNDMENIFPFLFLGAIYSMTGPSLGTARLHFVAFTAARVLHSVAYLAALPAPTRSLAYLAAQVPCLSMALQIMAAVASYA